MLGVYSKCNEHPHLLLFPFSALTLQTELVITHLVMPFSVHSYHRPASKGDILSDPQQAVLDVGS